MKVKQALDISKTMGYNVPVDMTDDILYWSETKKDWISILDMDIVYVVRALHGLSVKLQGSDINYTNIQSIFNSLDEYITDLRSEYE
jgi:hypothetical protein|tara:strand:+ start:49 stop:309 length:261 start_codon:yes stop_codon:yes gene_type:complete